MNKPSWLLYVAAFGVALAAAILVTPLIRRFAFRVGLADEPSSRKAHPEPIALLGGVAIYAAAAGAVFVLVPSASNTLKGVFLAGLVILVSGLQDDISEMDPLLKLVSQVTAALVMIGFGVRATPTDIGWVDSIITVVWVVAVVNAVNYQDNMDGLAAGLTAAACISFFVIAVVWDQYLVASLAAVLAGGTIGFLFYNFPPASIYMGDAGTHFLGFLLATMGVLLKFPTRPKLATLFVPVMILAVPLTDMAMVTISRRRRGVPVSQGGTDHSSHRLVVAGLTRRQAIMAMWAATLVTGGGALLATKLPLIPALVVVGLVGGGCIAAIAWLEHLGTPTGLVYEKAAIAPSGDESQDEAATGGPGEVLDGDGGAAP